MPLNVPKINVVTLTPEGFSIQGEAMDVSRSAPQGAHCHVDVIYLTSITGNFINRNIGVLSGTLLYTKWSRNMTDESSTQTTNVLLTPSSNNWE